jgi:hypothetical protein
MSRHYSKVDGVVESDGSKKRAINIDIENNEPNESVKDEESVGSQECVGNRTNSEWVVHRKSRSKVGGMKARPLTSVNLCVYQLSWPQKCEDNVQPST